MVAADSAMTNEDGDHDKAGHTKGALRARGRKAAQASWLVKIDGDRSIRESTRSMITCQ